MKLLMLFRTLGLKLKNLKTFKRMRIALNLTPLINNCDTFESLRLSFRCDLLEDNFKWQKAQLTKVRHLFSIFLKLVMGVSLNGGFSPKMDGL